MTSMNNITYHPPLFTDHELSGYPQQVQPQQNLASIFDFSSIDISALLWSPLATGAYKIDVRN